MKKSFLSLVLGVTLLFSTPVYASGVESTTAVNAVTQISTANLLDGPIVTPYLMVSKYVTVTYYYSSISSIPETNDYTEFYHNAWCSGTLNLQSVTATGTYPAYKAVYSGYIFGVVN